MEKSALYMVLGAVFIMTVGFSAVALFSALSISDPAIKTALTNRLFDTSLSLAGFGAGAIVGLLGGAKL